MSQKAKYARVVQKLNLLSEIKNSVEEIKYSVDGIKEQLNIKSLTPSIDYAFVTDPSVKNQLIADNLKMQDAYLAKRDVKERKIQYAVYATYQLEILLNYYFMTCFPLEKDIAQHVIRNYQNRDNQIKVKEWKDKDKSYQKVDYTLREFGLSSKIYLFGIINEYDKHFVYNLMDIKNIRDKYAHRSGEGCDKVLSQIEYKIKKHYEGIKYSIYIKDHLLMKVRDAVAETVAPEINQSLFLDEESDTSLTKEDHEDLQSVEETTYKTVLTEEAKKAREELEKEKKEIEKKIDKETIEEVKKEIKELENITIISEDSGIFLANEDTSIEKNDNSAEAHVAEMERRGQIEENKKEVDINANDIPGMDSTSPEERAEANNDVFDKNEEDSNRESFPSEQNEISQVQELEEAKALENNKRIRESVLKIPFLGIKYTRDKNGNIVDTGNLDNENPYLALFLDPDYMVPGFKYKVKIADNWESTTVYDWSVDENGKYSSKKVTFREWLDKRGMTETDTDSLMKYQEFRDKVPMSMVVNGMEIGPGVHDTDWWNPSNVNNFENLTDENGEPFTKEQKQIMIDNLIEEGIENTRKIRRAVLEGRNNMVVTERGVGLMRKSNTMQTMHDANPDAIMCYVGKYSVTYDSNGKGLNLHIINNGRMHKGFPYMLSRVGTTRNDEGELVPTYVASALTTNFRDAQPALREAYETLQAMYHTARVLNGIDEKGNKKEYTQQEIEKAEKIRDAVEEITHVDISGMSSGKFTGIFDIKNRFPQKISKKTNLDQRGETNEEGGKLTRKEKLKADLDHLAAGGEEVDRTGEELTLYLYEGEQAKGLIPVIDKEGNVKVWQKKVKNEDGTISYEDGTYRDFYEQNVYTGKQFYPLEVTDKDGNKKTIHVSNVQPKIQFEVVPRQEIEDKEILNKKEGLENELKKINDRLLHFNKKYAYAIINDIDTIPLENAINILTEKAKIIESELVDLRTKA